MIAENIQDWPEDQCREIIDDHGRHMNAKSIEGVFKALSEITDFIREEGISGPQKKEVVMSTVKEIYKKVNPDIPFIPEPFETWMENLLLDRALSEFIDFIVGKYKEKGILNRG